MNDSFEQARRHFVDGVAHLGADRLQQAERCFEAALALVPARVSTLVNLAATRIRLGRPEAALPLLDEAVAAAPGDADAWYQRARALAALQRPADALSALERLIALDPAHGCAWLRHGQALQALERHDEALGSYERALAIDPTLALASLNLGNLMRETGRMAEAAAAFRHALAHGADRTLVDYYLAATGEREAPAQAPRPYVERLFDDYAPTFDAHLAGLGYRAHHALAQQLRGLGAARHARALDLGCGTGLCGPLLRPMVDRLEGVDLSAAMLERARALGVYDRLAQADLVEHLKSTAPAQHDLVIAADVFIYLGALDKALAGVARVLVPGGVFAFSVESADDAVDFELRPSLRYAHSARYLRALASQAGLALERLHAAPVREEQQQPIAGLYACLRKT
jgi:predicted TPR repeat methyltransferase